MKLRNVLFVIGITLIILGLIFLAINIYQQSTSSVRQTTNVIVEDIFIVTDQGGASAGTDGLEYTDVPTISITAVVSNESVTIETHNLPPDEIFIVRMNYIGTQGLGGEIVGSLYSGAGGYLRATYPIPDYLKGQVEIAIRLESEQGYYSYNWFWNDTSGTGGLGPPVPIPTLPSNTPTLTPTPSQTPTTTPTATPLPNLPGEVEVEWPVKLRTGQSGIFTISLEQVANQIVDFSAGMSGRGGVPDELIPEYATRVATPMPLYGTPNASIEDAFGTTYRSCIRANLTGQGFLATPVSSSGSECKYFDENKIMQWQWVVMPRTDIDTSRPQPVIILLEGEWSRETPKGIIVKKEVIWREYFYVEIYRPLIKRGEINISNEVIALLTGGAIILLGAYIKQKFERATSKEQQHD